MSNLEQKLDSREVAEMVGKEHKNIIRDIRGYIGEFHSSILSRQISLRNLHIKMNVEKNIRAT